MDMSEGATVEARAKVNLFLHVTGRRDDGFHTLSSLVVRVSLADRLRLAAADRDRVRLSGPFAAALNGCEDGDNLALRAVRAVRELSGGFPVALDLEKHVPVAAGLGGGSADAAAALRAASRLFGTGLDEAALQRLAASLGADVPACLVDTPVLASGIGERLAPAPALPPFALVLVNPGGALATARVFGAFDEPVSAPAPLSGGPADLAALATELGHRRNDLEPAAIRLAPAVAEVIDLLAATPGVLLARMTGSGATCFGLVAPDGGEAVADALRRDRPQWWIEPVMPVLGPALSV